MTSLKRILNDEDDEPRADAERYEHSSKVHRFTDADMYNQSPSLEPYTSIESLWHAPVDHETYYLPDTWNSQSTGQYDNNGTLKDMSFGALPLLEEYVFSPEPMPVQFVQDSTPHHEQQINNDFAPTFPDNHDLALLELKQSLPVGESPTFTNNFSASASTVNGTPEVQNNKDICFGMVSQTTVRLIGDMQQLDHKLQNTKGAYGHGFTGFGLQQADDGIALHFFDDGTLFGSTNAHFSQGFARVLKVYPIRLEAITHIPSVRERIGRAQKATDATVRVDVFVFGLKSDASMVGKQLSDGKIWLQKPDFLPRDKEYFNPQVLKLEGFENIETDQPDTLDVPSGQSGLERDDEGFQDAVKDVFDKLTRIEQLERVDQDQRVRTELLQHQEEGLGFMIQRETGQIPDKYLLWEEIKDGDNIRYRHAVTGAVSHIRHPESGGGVLADDMGMGKSLSILSLIAKTSHLADEWLYNSQEGASTMKCHSRATLIIVSSALLINEWIHEVDKHLDGSISFVKYHGTKRRTLKNRLQTADIVLTTYNTLVQDFHQNGRRTPHSVLHEINFFRVVLDEAHIIRRKGTLFNKAVSELSAKSRWCLTGTPIQNKFEDIGALFAFIRARPFHNIGMFRQFISNPFDDSKERRTEAIRRLATLIDALCIRRTKDRLKLPEAQDSRVELIFSDAEQRQYTKAVGDMNRNLRQQVGSSKSMHDFGLFQIQLQLRILCNHGTHQDPFAWKQNAWMDMRQYALTSLLATSEVVCSICNEIIPVTSAQNIYRMHGDECRHAICDGCSDLKTGHQQNLFSCPICMQVKLLKDVEERPAAKKILNAQYFRENGYSTKITQLVKDLTKNLNEKKSIVFSCWTRSLELIGRYLTDASITFERIDGGISLQERERILNKFATHRDLHVLIMTTGTGAYGLNLTAANRIFIIEPQWNPAVENQAIARAVRLGQEESVQVVRYVMNGTVEQAMRSQQNKKLMIAGILDQSANAAADEQESIAESSHIIVEND
ncbi:hypothetical protein BT63DRAFT_460620 [Microthyrium microscopicum]|uniref:Uncharacterized protein n=1 Tax=Microthyrium microscopicum TaxID=703497 RepID=A0A6A6TZM2_9PEZI|nr:hypothetical protein BT63DRAFT_460620 [Microthyrium microscopicum]